MSSPNEPLNDYLYNIWINEKDESKLIRKEKNLPRQKEKKFGEISVRDTEVLVDGDPRRLSWKGFCWLSLLCELKYESFVVRGRRNFMGFVGFFIFYCKYKLSVFILITFLKIYIMKINLIIIPNMNHHI